MSQSPYQPPYPPPGSNYPAGFDYYQPQQTDPLAPARRAGVLMWILGGLLLLLGGCNLASAMTMPLEEAYRQQAALLPPGESLPVTVEQFGRFLIAAAVVTMGVGVVLVVLGSFVRSGRRAPIIVSILVVGLLALLMGLLVLIALLRMTVQPAMGMLGCAFAVPLSLLVLLLVWLIQANRAASQVERMRAYSQQYWQQAYQQQWYQQPGHPQPTAAPPPLPPPPSNGHSGGSHGQ
jgi:hypothetical protein